MGLVAAVAQTGWIVSLPLSSRATRGGRRSALETRVSWRRTLEPRVVFARRRASLAGVVALGALKLRAKLRGRQKRALWMAAAVTGTTKKKSTTSTTTTTTTGTEKVTTKAARSKVSRGKAHKSEGGARNRAKKSVPQMRRPSPMNRVYLVNEPLRALVGAKLLRRSEVCRLVAKYAKDKDLVVASDKRMFTPDAALCEALALPLPSRSKGRAPATALAMINRLVSANITFPKHTGDSQLIAEAKQLEDEYMQTPIPPKKLYANAGLAQKRDQSGLYALCRPSRKLQPIIGGSKPVTYVGVNRLVWAYIRAEALQDKHDRRIICCNKPLKALTGAETISMFDLSKVIFAHLTPIK
uniref:DM2 domain-containing protein n=1 Tax=Erythrolobus australicus TaxID=1077150 RepID=A0A7S1TLG2_9RHOD